MINRIKGTQDFLDMRLLNYIIQTCTEHFAHHNIHEIATPIIEKTELFRRSLGLQTDVVSKEMFILASRREDQEDSMCLRPEATASIVRAYIENGVQESPWKVFTWGPMFRYEQPQKGRYRQFHQVSLEMIGVTSVSYDVELIMLFDRLFKDIFKITDTQLLINYLGCLQDRNAYKIVLKDFLHTHVAELCSLCIERTDKNILRVFDCKKTSCQQIYEQAPRLAHHFCTNCATEWEHVQTLLKSLHIAYTWNQGLVRGLDYYNKTVFEFASSALGAQSAFCGGGRYDSLMTELGGKQDRPSVGAAIGIERLMLLLASQQESVVLAQQKPLYMIIPFEQAQHSIALALAGQLTGKGIRTDVLLDQESIKSKLRKAHTAHAAYCLLIGSEEQLNGTVTVKDMINGTEEKLSQNALLEKLAC